MSIVELVPIEKLETLAATAEPERTNSTTLDNGHSSAFDLSRWIADHRLDVTGPQDWQGGKGKRWVFKICPWNPDHTNSSAYIVQLTSGAVAAGCHHEGCKNNDWHALRDRVEPGWRERKQDRDGGHTPRPFSREELAEFGIKADTEPIEVRRSEDRRGEQPWGEVEPFDAFDLPTFPLECLPSPLREWAETEAEATQTPVDLPAMMEMAVVSACCAKRVEVSPGPSWNEPCNIYVVVVLPPGERKSAVFAHATEPLREHEQELAERTGATVREYAIQRRTLEGRLGKLESKAAKADDPKERRAPIEDAKAVAEELALLVPVVTPRLIVDDCTTERLTGLLVEQGGRIAVMAPEGGVFDLMKGAYSKAGIPMFDVYLKGHSGDDTRVDRVSRPSEFVLRPAITLALTVQPDVIHGMFEVAAFRGRGLLGRILYSIPKSTLGTRNVNPPPVPKSVVGDYRDMVKGLCCLSPNLDDHGRHIPHMAALAPEALDVLHEAMKDLEPKLGPGGSYEHFRDWAAKLIGAEVRISALLHVVANIQHGQPWSVPIRAETMQAAITIGNYLAEHASAAYTLMGTNVDVSDAEHVWKWIARRGMLEFTKRDAYQAMKHRFVKAEKLDAPLVELARRNLIRQKLATIEPKSGRPASPAFEVNADAMASERKT